MEHQTNNSWEIIFQGGVFMIPLLMCSIFVFGITLERMIFFKKIRINLTEFKKNIFNLLREGRVKDALHTCDDSSSCIAKIYKAGIIKTGCEREEIKFSMEDAAAYQIPRLELRLNALSTIGYICPLLGFLGTAVEMITNFQSLHQQTAATSSVSSIDLAGAIAAALIPTATGLAIAIVTYSIYGYFVNRINYYVIELETASNELINFMSQSNDNISQS